MIPPVFRSFAKVCAWLVLVGLCGCGGVNLSTPPVTTPIPVAAAIDGRWEFQTFVTSVASAGSFSPSSLLIFSGVLSVSGTSVSGVGQVQFAGALGTNAFTCIFPATVKVHGTFSSTRHLTLTSDTVNGTVFTFDADIPATLPDTVSLTEGIAATGSATGSCAVAATNGIANFSQPLTGNYAGTMVNAIPFAGGAVDPAVAKATVTLTESDPDMATGVSNITGQATLTYPACSVTLPVSQTRVGARNSAIQLFPATPPVVAAFALRAGQIGLNVWDLGSDCKTQPATPQITSTSEWAGIVSKQ